MNKIYSKIDELAPKYTQFLTDICNIESKSEDYEGINKVGEFTADFAEKIGFSVKRKSFGKGADCWAITFNPESKGELVSLSAHMDTVHVKGKFGYPPVKNDGEYLYGPGVADCKGGIAVYLLAMEALKESGYSDRPVKLILQCDEEVESIPTDGESLKFMCDEAKGSVAFINGEAYRKGKITVERKGIARYKLHITGIPVHSGIYEGGASAVREAAYKIIELEKISDVNGITFNCGIINGGGVINIIPEHCDVTLEFRFRTKEQMKTAEEHLKKVAKTTYVEGTHTELEYVSSRIAMEPSEKNMELFEKINEICKKRGFGEMEAYRNGGGSDAAYTSDAGIPTVDSLGIEGDGYHTEHERAKISSIADNAKIIAAIINDIK